MRKYLAIYENTVTGYSAYAPDLPGCITTGPTLEDTARLMQEAREFHLDGLREDGLPNPGAVHCCILRGDGSVVVRRA